MTSGRSPSQPAADGPTSSGRRRAQHSTQPVSTKASAAALAIARGHMYCWSDTCCQACLSHAATALHDIDAAIFPAHGSLVHAGCKVCPRRWSSALMAPTMPSWQAAPCTCMTLLAQTLPQPPSATPVGPCAWPMPRRTSLPQAQKMAASGMLLGLASTQLLRPSLRHLRPWASPLMQSHEGLPLCQDVFLLMSGAGI